MSLKGSLSSINLADIIQLVSNSKQTGRFVLSRSSGQKGAIYLKNGEIVHALNQGTLNIEHRTSNIEH